MNEETKKFYERLNNLLFYTKGCRDIALHPHCDSFEYIAEQLFILGDSLNPMPCSSNLAMQVSCDE